MRYEEPSSEKLFSRFAACSLIIFGLLASCAVGLILGEQLSRQVILSHLPFFFDQHLRPELLIYPPVIVLIVDLIHTMAVKMDL
jgi:hypothetical protein